MKILFYPDRGWGRGLSGKRARKFERSGFRRCPLVELARSPAEADVIYLRYIPERTTAARLSELQRFLERWPDRGVINHPRTFYLHDSKDRTFAAWNEAGVTTPEYVSCQDVEELLSFAASHPSVLVRVNNQACGDGTTLLECAGEDRLRQAHGGALAEAQRLRYLGREDARAMAVEFLDSRHDTAYHRIFRAFVIGEVVYGGYALISTEPVVNFATADCSSADEVDLFLSANSVLEALLADATFRATLRTAARVLGLDIAAVDFIQRGEQVYLLEANPLWSPSFRWAGGRRGRSHFLRARTRWLNAASNYCRWMDRAAFYEGMYALFAQFLPSRQ